MSTFVCGKPFIVWVCQGKKDFRYIFKYATLLFSRFGGWVCLFCFVGLVVGLVVWCVDGVWSVGVCFVYGVGSVIAFF